MDAEGDMITEILSTLLSHEEPLGTGVGRRNGSRLLLSTNVELPLKDTSECLEFIIWESLTDQPSFHKFLLMFLQVKMRLRSNLVPVDNQMGIMHLLPAINQEQAYIITLLIPAHRVRGGIKVSHNAVC